MSQFCQFLVLKICFVIALGVYGDLSTVLAETETTGGNANPLTASNTILLYPSSTTSDAIFVQSASSYPVETSSNPPMISSRFHAAFPSPGTPTPRQQSSSMHAGHYSLQPSFSTSDVPSIASVTMQTPSLSLSKAYIRNHTTSHLTNQVSTAQFYTQVTGNLGSLSRFKLRSTSPTTDADAQGMTLPTSHVSQLQISTTTTSPESIRYSTTAVLQSSSATKLSSTHLSTTVMLSLASQTISSTGSDAYSTASLGMYTSVSTVSSFSPTTDSATTEKKTSTLKAIIDEEDDSFVLGLSIGLSAAVAAFVCLLIVVIFWKRCGQRVLASDTKMKPPPKTECPAASKTPTDGSHIYAQNGDCRYRSYVLIISRFSFLYLSTMPN